MKFFSLSLLFLGLFGFVLSSQAMPPAPELLSRLQSGEIDEPYFLRNEQTLRMQGVEAPHVVNWRNRATDETDTTNFPALLLLVDFSDQPTRTSATFFDSLMFGNSQGKVNHFYKEISYQTLYFSTQNWPSAVGWIRAPQTYDYYVNGQNGMGDYPRNCQRLVEDVVNIANASINFANYDIDNDGTVDGLMIVHSGEGAELTGSGNDIWSHAWSTADPVSVDGKTVTSYNTVPEFWQSPGDMTCGVFAHEMGHSFFGLPDLYDTDYSSEGIGRWSLMAGGSWNGARGASPAHPDAYCRIAMGFATATNVTTALMNQQIQAVENHGTIYRMWRNGGATGNQYFLVENRQQVGYDIGIPSNGLLIYHIDRSTNSNRNEWYPGNTTNGHFRVALEQADGRWDLEHGNNGGDTGDPFPGSSVNRNFTTSTIPNSRSYTNSTTQVAVMGISNSGLTMTADLQVNGGSIVMEAPNGGEMWSIGGSYTIEWAPDAVTGPKTIELNRHYPEGAWEVLAANLTADSTFSWLVNGDTTSFARIRVRATTMTPEVYGISDADFTIGLGTITMTRPNGGEAFIVGNRHAITWQSNGLSGRLRIEIDRNYPSGTWETVIDSISLNSPYAWICTGPGTELARLRIRTLEMAVELCDTSDAEFSIRATSVGESTIQPPVSYSLLKVSPNPFNASATIRYRVRSTGMVSVAVYDLQGHRVASLYSGLATNGEHLVQWDGSQFAAGTYFVKLSGAENAITKVVLLK
ncbi:MAG: M6 family metalloprotease domain-containing protein [bacterium]|nr:M6 family metalloprotease domain-containing protein [bacterium]